MTHAAELPLYFGPAERRLFGWYHPARGAAWRNAAVVVCNPLGYEAICAYRSLRHLAERLARAGFAVLRFDYHGTGDSAGDDRDPERVSAWLEGIGAAVDELRRRSGAAAVSLFGLRLGATLATAAAAARRDLAGLVLWSPCASGKAYLRELRAFRLLAARELELERGRAPVDAAGAEGDEDAAGFFFTAATAASVAQLDLLALRERPAPRALVVARDERPTEQRLVAHLQSLGVDVTLRPVAGYADMMVDPHKSVVPDAVLDSIVAWLSASHAQTDRTGAAEGAQAATAESAQAAAAGGSPQDEAPQLDLLSDGEPIREVPQRFGDDERLFGILTEPARAPAAGRTAVLLLNAGAVHRVGSNRMYVTMARAWAALGFTVLRLDIAGIGDSQVAGGQVENVTYSTTAVSDVAAAIAHLRRVRRLDRFVLGGLCSGAYVAFHAGLAGLPVAGNVMINPQTFYYKEGDPLDVSVSRNYNEARHYRRALFSRQSWAKAMRGGVSFKYIFGVMRARAAIVAGARLRQLRGLVGSAQTEDLGRDLRAVVERGIDTFFVFSTGDPGLGYLDLHARRALRRLRRRDNFHLAIIDGADHTFTPLWSQTRLRQVITDHLVRRHGQPA